MGKKFVLEVEKTAVDATYVKIRYLASTILSRQFSRHKIEGSIT